jgi:N-acetylmuramoyl-L-alanine amidase
MNQMIQHPSPNFNDRPAAIEIDMLVLHYTGMRTANEALDRMCDPVAEVSAHYMIDEDGQVYQLVGEEKRSWHAGVSSWRGNSNINDRSIGIELANPGHEFGYRAFPAAQFNMLIALTKEILVRHSIPARNIVGHSDIAPARKQDPGELLDWAQLASHGIGLWPVTSLLQNTNEDEILDFSLALQTYGYDITDSTATTRAFQRHFRPSVCNGQGDSETRKNLQALLRII